VTEKLRELGSREGVTSFMILLATFQLLLFHYSGHGEMWAGVFWIELPTQIPTVMLYSRPWNESREMAGYFKIARSTSDN
jgi:hypothetical protein